MWRIQAFDRDGRQVASLDVGGGEITIGREADRRLVLPSPAVSRRHAKVVLDGPQPYVVDEGSANGVLVNGVRIFGPTALVPGTRIDIAEFRLEFDAAPQAHAHGAGYGAPPSQGYDAPQSQGYGAPPSQGYGATPSQGYRAPAQHHGSFSAAPTPIRLIAEDGPFAGQVFDVRPGLVALGRAIDNDLVFDDPSLSRKHARLRHNGDHIEIEDLGSSNGSYVSGRRIQAPTVARPGDVVRFGELHFRLDGDRPAAHSNAVWNAPSGTDVHEALPDVPQRQRVPPLLIYGGAGVLVAIVGVLTAVFLLRGKSGGGADAIAQMQAQAAQHLKSGKEKLDVKDFVGAQKEFDQVLEVDPANAEARKLRKVAVEEPPREQLSKQIKVKLTVASSRSDIEAVSRLYGQIPPESVFHGPATQRLVGKLVSFGKDQCKARKLADCAWAICRAYDVAPAGERATLIPSDAEALLKEAERKLARDKSYTPCKKH